MARFHMRIAPAPPGAGNLVIPAGPSGAPERAVFWPLGARDSPAPARLEMHADWGAEINPLLAALPARVEISARDDAETGLLLRMLLAEAEARRCGAEGALARLTEVLLIRMLRAEIARGSTTPGLLGGLSDPRLSRAIVAMHDMPGRAWRNADLAAIAGLSLSRFAEVFAATVGITPMAYLRRWRLTLAYQQIEAGARVKAVAHDLGYGSPEALSRAFRVAFGSRPTRLRAA
jgi:AraC-like DNA-binding protein